MPLQLWAVPGSLPSSARPERRLRQQPLRKDQPSNGARMVTAELFPRDSLLSKLDLMEIRYSSTRLSLLILAGLTPGTSLQKLSSSLMTLPSLTMFSLILPLTCSQMHAPIHGLLVSLSLWTTQWFTTRDSLLMEEDVFLLQSARVQSP